MGEVIYKADRWLIERQPGTITDPMVVQFVKRSTMRMLLNQSARWTPAGWDSRRWMPRPPMVPRAIVDLVEAHMRGRQP